MKILANTNFTSLQAMMQAASAKSGQTQSAYAKVEIAVSATSVETAEPAGPQTVEQVKKRILRLS